MKKLALIIVMVIPGFSRTNGYVKVWVDRENGSVYRARDPVSINVLSQIDGYLYLYNIDAEGKPHLIFPKRGVHNWVRAGLTYRLPDDFEMEISWYVGDNPGVEYVYAIVTPYPIYYPDEYGFEPLPPGEFYYYHDFPVLYRFIPPPYFPHIYFDAWAYFYVRPRHYVYYYHPSPWYCYDCHAPRILVSFWFDFCPIYIVEAHDYGYYYYPRYYRYYRYKYKHIRPRYRSLSTAKATRYRELEKKYRNYSEPPEWVKKDNLLKKRVRDVQRFDKPTERKREVIKAPPKRDYKSTEKTREGIKRTPESRKKSPELEKSKSSSYNYYRDYEKQKVSKPRTNSPEKSKRSSTPDYQRKHKDYKTDDSKSGHNNDLWSPRRNTTDFNQRGTKSRSSDTRGTNMRVPSKRSSSPSPRR